MKLLRRLLMQFLAWTDQWFWICIVGAILIAAGIPQRM